MKWYTLNTKPHAEYQVANALRRRHLHVFLPEIKIYTPKKPSVQKPFFPSYLFVKLDLNRTGISAIRWTPGLRRIVTFDDCPTPINNDIIELIRQKAAELSADTGQREYPFRAGDTVRIVKGPFGDMLATFDRAVSGSERVQILLNILGHASRLQMSAANLKKTNGRSPPPLKRLRRTRGRGRRIKPSP